MPGDAHGDHAQQPAHPPRVHEKDGRAADGEPQERQRDDLGLQRHGVIKPVVADETSDDGVVHDPVVELVRAFGEGPRGQQVEDGGGQHGQKRADGAEHHEEHTGTDEQGSAKRRRIDHAGIIPER